MNKNFADNKRTPFRGRTGSTMQPLHSILQRQATYQSMFFYVRGAVTGGCAEVLPSIRRFCSEFLPESPELEETLHREYYRMLNDFLGEKEVFK